MAQLDIRNDLIVESVVAGTLKRRVGLEKSLTSVNECNKFACKD